MGQGGELRSPLRHTDPQYWLEPKQRQQGSRRIDSCSVLSALSTRVVSLVVIGL
jgi:hypothetical protein